MPKFDYIKLENISPIPIADLFLRNPSFPEKSIYNNCGVVDTGSDATLVSWSDISRLQLKPLKTNNSIPFKGLGRFINGSSYLLEISFDDIKYFRARVIAVPDDDLNGELIIGRNILNRYVVTFDGPKLIFTIFD